MKHMTRSRTRTLIECALMIALGTILAQIKLLPMPFGGSVTLCSLLPFIIISLRHGTNWGLLAGFVNALLQMLTDFHLPPSNTLLAVAGVVLLDYVLAFMLLGLAQLFAAPFQNRIVGVAVGTAAACLIRFLCSFLSGALLWGSYQSSYEWAAGLNVWTYSLIYNGSYMLPEAILTIAVSIILAKVAPSLLILQNNNNIPIKQ